MGLIYKMVKLSGAKGERDEEVDTDALSGLERCDRAAGGGARDREDPGSPLLGDAAPDPGAVERRERYDGV